MGGGAGWSEEGMTDLVQCCYVHRREPGQGTKVRVGGHVTFVAWCLEVFPEFSDRRREV